LLGAATYQRNKVWSSSLEFWKNIIQNAPQKARGYNNYGVELSGINKHKEAIPYFKKAIKLEGATYYDPYTNLANSYAVMGDIDLAIATLEQSLNLNPYNAEAYNNLGAFLLHKKEFEFAKKSLDAALLIRPHYGRAMYNLGKLYLVQENLEEAWMWFKKACTQADLDNDLRSFQLYATSSIYLKKYDDAIYACKKFLQFATDKNDINEALFNLGNAYFLNKDLPNAEKVFEGLTVKFPADIRGWANLVETYIQMNQMQKALDVIKKIMQSGRTFPGLEIQQAICFGELGHYDLCEKTILDYLKQNPPENLRKIAYQVLDRLK